MILVIGATGTVDSLLVRQLVETGHAVRALTRNPAKAAMFDGKAEVVVGDLDDEDSIASAMQEVSLQLMSMHEFTWRKAPHPGQRLARRM